ncbi:hypothetical protein BDV12DRAFT_45311 [Aspergillus spectabilis]
MDSPRTTKRQKKTLLACTPCRSKKVKCDGHRPVCGACSKNGWTESKCVWKRIDGRDALVPDSDRSSASRQDQATRTKPACSKCFNAMHLFKSRGAFSCWN